ncbi:MAG: TonB-dependent receptor domain-containing protein [Gammaproteobacteria bacterium]|jgi:outer membrane receptor protein involved in Fe transport
MNRVHRAVAAVLFAATLTHTTALADPQASDRQAAEALAEVVVTGSRIKRAPATAPTPLIQIEREDIVRSGLGSVIDVLADVPALSGSLVQEDTTGSVLNTGGLSLLNLRDLGSGRTLTLVDGRRHVGSNAGTLAVDVDTIPRLLIDRVEIITGANSALYGADAVSGAVNFVMRRDYEGIQIDAGSSMINKNGELNNRVSLLGGTNLFGDRLNVYGAYEREQNEEVRDEDVDWRRDAWGFLGVDFDPTTAPNDGVVDNILVSGLRNISRSRGGTLILTNDIPADPTRNIPAGQTCALGTTGPISANCIFAEPGRTYQFDNQGVGRLANFGTIRNTVGRNRSLNVGGDGLNINTEFSQFSRVPEAQADRFQGGANFNLTESVQLFAEAKYVKEETSFESQQTFFDIGIVNQPVNTNTALIATSAFNTGLDNAYLDPAVRTAILNNVRPVISAAGVQTGTVADPRARLSIFGPSRTQKNEKELMRYVVGVRGETESLGFINDLSYELSYTYGKLENTNREAAVDVVRFKHSADAVVDTLGRVSGRPGQIVCRVQLLAANGIAIPDQLRGGVYNPTNPEIANCVPSRVFGEGGYSQAALDFFGAAINVRQKNEQQDALGFVSGNLWDLWGAGPIGFALGMEYREEKTEGIGRSRDTGDRLLFLNTGADFLPAKYDTTEYFGELRLPLLKDMAFTRSLEVGAAFRSSDYSTVGKTDTYSLNVVWRPIDDITLRATRGKAVRIPTLGENFAPASQTFANGFVDPCSATVIAGLADTVVRANRQKNCVELGIPAGTVINYTSGIPGKNAGNPFLLPETSFTNTVSLVVTPRFLPKATLVVDYYEIEIKDVIASVSAQTAANQCVSEANLNPAICATLTRTGATPPGTAPAYGIIDFIQGSVNYAKLYTRGIDYQLFYRTDSNLSFRLSGNYLFDWRNHNNIALPATYGRAEGYVAFPRTRFSLTTEWQPNDKLSLQWKADYQASQYLLNANTLGGNDDLYETTDYYDTASFIQHDISARYNVMDNLSLRGGVVNAFDKKPSKWLGNSSDDNFDLFGRRFFVGVNYDF